MIAGLRNMLLLTVCLFFTTGHAWAVALGKIEVASHLGETFFAEVPLQLDSGEKISNVFVGLAEPSDYQVLEVFHDPALNELQVEIKNDLRGPRVVVSSSAAVDTPYFNLVLKVKHGHATNFKKYPVFLDLPDQIRPQPVPQATLQPAPAFRQSIAQPEAARPSVSAVTIEPIEQAVPSFEPEPVIAPAPDSVEPAKSTEVAPTGSEFAPYEGWARTSRYGPMVRGDTITTVARRLPVDERYSLNQIIVGLYNKNKAKFRSDNINLINAGTYLDVPTADDIEAIEERQAKSILREHNRRWNQLKKQPFYAAEAEAQKNRYRPRVRVGKLASGEAAAPLPVAQAEMPMADQGQGAAQGSLDPDAGMAAQLRALQEDNLRLKQALRSAEQKAETAVPATADTAVAEEKVKKLELTVARLQRQLNQLNTQLEESRAQDMGMLSLVLIAVIVLLIGVAGYLLYLLKRDRPHPAMDTGYAEAVSEPAMDDATAVADEVAVVDEALRDEPFDEEEVVQQPDEEEVATTEAAEDAQADESLLFGEKETLTPEEGVDYLAEADVYLRYGMEDEAVQQLKLAIEQRPDNAEAHAKLVELLRTRGDQDTVQTAMDAARLVLAGTALQSFEAAIAVDANTGQAQTDAAVDAEQDAEELPAAEADEIDLSFGEDVSEVVEPEDGDVLDDTASAEVGEAQAQDDAVALDFSIDEVTETAPEDAPESIPEEDAGESGALEFSADDFATDNDTPEQSAADEQDFVSSVQISAADDGEDSSGTGEEISEGVDFTISESASLEDDLSEALSALDDESPDDDGADASAAEGDGALDLATTEGDLNLDDILAGVQSSESDDGAMTPEIAPPDDGVPETEVDVSSSGEDMNLDEILGEVGGADAAREAPVATENVAAETDDGLDLNDILGDLDIDDLSSATGESPDQALTLGEDSAAAGSEDEETPAEMDISDELDGLLAEWDAGETVADTGPGTLEIDRARSLLAEGLLDDAELALQSAVEGERRGDALIGLAELAARRGDDARKNELLTEAETLLDDSNREWFESVKDLTA